MPMKELRPTPIIFIACLPASITPTLSVTSLIEANIVDIDKLMISPDLTIFFSASGCLSANPTISSATLITPYSTANTPPNNAIPAAAPPSKRGNATSIEPSAVIPTAINVMTPNIVAAVRPTAKYLPSIF